MTAEPEPKDEFQQQATGFSSVSSRFLEEILGDSDAMKKLRDDIDMVAETKATVLIQGETGTGKELVARTIHKKSGINAHKIGSYVVLNCSGFPETLLESELFGHEKGAYTDAAGMKPGLFELAEHGTLFLDEIGEMPLSMQPKILRAIQEKEIRRLGATTLRKLEFRLIAGTNRDLRGDIKEKRFREDLFYRLNRIPITVPPLRERGTDIISLAQIFYAKYCQEHYGTKSVLQISRIASDAFLRYNWPGNVRELEAVMERYAILNRGKSAVLEQDSVTKLLELSKVESAKYISGKVPASMTELAQFAEEDIERTGIGITNYISTLRGLIYKVGLDRHNRKVSQVAIKLKISRTSFYDRLELHGIDRRDYSKKKGKNISIDGKVEQDSTPVASPNSQSPSYSIDEKVVPQVVPPAPVVEQGTYLASKALGDIEVGIAKYRLQIINDHSEAAKSLGISQEHLSRLLRIQNSQQFNFSPDSFYARANMEDIENHLISERARILNDPNQAARTLGISETLVVYVSKARLSTKPISYN